MEQNVNDFTAGKIKLIYEFNNGSPLFARVASILIEEGNIPEAVSILGKGISNYPDYPAAYFVYALAEAYSGNEKSAKDFVKKGAALINSTESEEFYFKKINSIISERNSLNNAKRPSFIETKEEKPGTQNDFELHLESLAETLSNAKINYNPVENQPVPEKFEEFKGEKIASETLANIYISQSKYVEAISVYKELVKKNPDRADQYAAKVAELQNIIDEESGIQLF
ncbi:MAG: hypothetical protein HYS25_00065 [Ignavibacteriales bacterium]|nr:hypothetical protein [Ignavibacteriales bacterium]